MSLIVVDPRGPGTQKMIKGKTCFVCGESDFDPMAYDVEIAVYVKVTFKFCCKKCSCVYTLEYRDGLEKYWNQK